MAIHVNMEFDHNDDPAFFVAVDGTRWHYEDVHGFDWKQDKEVRRVAMKIARRGGDPVELFDGSDTVWVADMKEAIRGRRR